MTKYHSFTAAQVQPMSEEQTQMFLTLIMVEESRPPVKFGLDIANEIGGLAKILYFGLLQDEVEVSEPLALWCVVLSGPSPAKVALWAFTMLELYKKADRKMLMLKDWTSAFPAGVPTDDEFIRIWDAQKLEVAFGGNGLDTPQAWNPLTAKIN